MIEVLKSCYFENRSDKLSEKVRESLATLVSIFGPFLGIDGH